MLCKKNIWLINTLLILLLCLGCFVECKAVSIPGFPNPEADSYTITLKGDVLNSISGLNIKIRLNDNKADIQPGVSFSSMGANSILSSVIGPEGDQFTISVALNGMITDGQASISGKFIQGSFSPQAEFNIVKIERDGGVDITSQLTTNVTFTVPQKATPTPTSTPSSTPVATPTPDVSTNPIPASTPGQIFVDYLSGASGETALSVETTQQIDAAVANSDSDTVYLKGDKQFQLKPNGLNKYFARLEGVINTKGTDYDSLKCIIITDVYNDLDLDELQPAYFRPANEFFTVKFQINNFKLRFKKTIKIPFIPTGDGASIVKGDYIDPMVDLTTVCVAYNSNDPAFVNSSVDDNTSLQDKNILAINRILNLPTANKEIFVEDLNFKIVPPKAASVAN